MTDRLPKEPPPKRMPIGIWGGNAWPHDDTAEVIAASFRAAERYSLVSDDWHTLHLATLLRGGLQIMNSSYVLRHVVTLSDLEATAGGQAPQAVSPEKIGQVLLATTAYLPFELESSTGEWGGDRYRPLLTDDRQPYMVFGDTGICLTPATVLNGGIEVVSFTPTPSPQSW